MGGLLGKIRIPSGAVKANVDSRLTRGACQADVQTHALGVAPGGVVARGMEKGAVEVTGMESGAVRIVNQGEGVLVALVAALAIVVLGKVENVVAVTVLGGIALIGAIIHMRRDKPDSQQDTGKHEKKKSKQEFLKPAEEEDIMITVSANYKTKHVTNIETTTDDEDKSDTYTEDDDKTDTNTEDEDKTDTNTEDEDKNDAPSDTNREHEDKTTTNTKDEAKTNNETEYEDKTDNHTQRIKIGASVAQSALTDMFYCVAATLTITNQTKHTMKEDKTFVTSGHVKVPAREIRANNCEAMAMHKYSGTATGSYGVTSFALGNEDEEDMLVILWGVPYNQNHRSNWLGLVIVPTATDVNEDTFNQMWYKQFHGNTLKEFYYDTNMVTFSTDKWRVEGTMGTAHKTEITITVYQE